MESIKFPPEKTMKTPVRLHRSDSTQIQDASGKAIITTEPNCIGRDGAERDAAKLVEILNRPKMSQRSKEISVAAIYFFREQAEHGYDDADVDTAKAELESLLKDA